VVLDNLSAAELATVQEFLNAAFVELAQLIILDGEGATKFVHVKVLNGLTVNECKQLAFTVAESPLVKTALFASDANWGRILAAAGRAGLKDLDVDKVALRINGVLIAENGGRALSYTEEAGERAMASENIIIELDLSRGSEQATVWTSDLSHEYVTINAEYRT
ncbi:MAG: bifunctional ornithine acetyltransferase/N-acetylglutamate synthase, partial [Sinobacterium sp.]|nr:bifunctional ornithine acetyltransferase/N-acetylglutamate synthase [Sinobacterium sp.]